LKKLENKKAWMSAEYDQFKDEYVSDDERLLDFENIEIEKELNDTEGGEPQPAGGAPAPAKAGGEKAPAAEKK